MNRYPLWKNVAVLIAVMLGLLYTLPNFFGEAPAVQVASVKSTHKVDAKLMTQVQDALNAAAVVPQGVVLDLNSVRVRLADTDTQIKAKDVIEKALNERLPHMTAEQLAALAISVDAEAVYV